MPSKRKFFLTTVTVDILTEGAPVDEATPLDAIQELISDGSGVGRIRSSNHAITSWSAATALKTYGSAPGFFGLDDRGEDVGP